MQETENNKNVKRAPKTVKGIEVELIAKKDAVIDNLCRMGIANRKDRKLFSSCYLITAENGKNYIAHFKDLLKIPNSDEMDIKRRNTIIWLLAKWGLVRLVNGEIEPNSIQKRKMFILTKEQLENEGWEIVHKFHYTKSVKTKEVN